MYALTELKFNFSSSMGVGEEGYTLGNLRNSKQLLKNVRTF